MAKIILKFKETALQEIPLEKERVTIGRKAENDIPIDNMSVSGLHAQILKEGDSFFVEDLGSLNGTFLNGRKVTKNELFRDDTILIGLHTLEFVSDKIRPAEDKKAFAVRGHSMDETVVIDPKDQKKILDSRDKEKPEPLGGFFVLEGSTEHRDYELKERVSSIGKESGSAIRLKGFFAPKVAALVNRRKEGYFITPSGDKPLKINGKELNRRYDLKDGDIVEVAGLKLQFYVKED
ncbi:MAG: FHA domain-containing protein [Deltaproteobacteria bacterium]|nr:FHA domain-containing protein [Deltaproteobacteria bacterium]